MKLEVTRERLRSVPTTPGVYMFLDDNRSVLYVGKAIKLRNRLKSYFSGTKHTQGKSGRIAKRASDFEFIVTDSEQEALILEATLIKRHKPQYNVRLKDDKSYPYIRIDTKEDFPLVNFSRRPLNDGARYFGPYASAGSVRRTLDILNKLFPYRSCTKNIDGHDKHPCLEYHIHRCIAPCTGLASKEEYKKVIDQVILFLEGKTEEVLKTLKGRMSLASESTDFERAAIIRDQIKAIYKLTEAQKVVSGKKMYADIVGLSHKMNQACIQVFFVREGKVVGRDHYMLEGAQDESEDHILSQFLKQFYSAYTIIPPLILLQRPIEDASAIQEWLQSIKGSKVNLQVPKKGPKHALTKMVAENAAHGLEQVQSEAIFKNNSLEAVMKDLQDVLNLPSKPIRIECYDISNIQGTNSVGSMVVFENGRPAPHKYRRFKIKGVKGIDDYSMMREVLLRRFKHISGGQKLDLSSGEPHDETWAQMPKLVLIDGGKGHLSAALQVFLELGISFVPVASLAKSQEEVFVTHSSDSIVLPRDSKTLFLLQRLRDEAHRFAITFHRNIRSKNAIKSALDSIAGIGPKRKRALLKHFGSIGSIKSAELDEISLAANIGPDLSQKVRDGL